MTITNLLVCTASRNWVVHILFNTPPSGIRNHTAEFHWRHLLFCLDLTWSLHPTSHMRKGSHKLSHKEFYENNQTYFGKIELTTSKALTLLQVAPVLLVGMHFCLINRGKAMQLSWNNWLHCKTKMQTKKPPSASNADADFLYFTSHWLKKKKPLFCIYNWAFCSKMELVWPYLPLFSSGEMQEDKVTIGNHQVQCLIIILMVTTWGTEHSGNYFE